MLGRTPVCNNLTSGEKRWGEVTGLSSVGAGVLGTPDVGDLRSGESRSIEGLMCRVGYARSEDFLSNGEGASEAKGPWPGVPANITALGADEEDCTLRLLWAAKRAVGPPSSQL